MILLPLAIVALAAFTGDHRRPRAAAGQAHDEFTLPPGRGAAATRAGSLARRGTLTGEIGFDDVEDGCLRLRCADGRRFEVVLPGGWSVDRTAGRLFGPGGVVVTSGDTVGLTGAIDRRRSSTCQIGPIFAATEVRVGVPPGQQQHVTP